MNMLHKLSPLLFYPPFAFRPELTLELSFIVTNYFRKENIAQQLKLTGNFEERNVLKKYIQNTSTECEGFFLQQNTQLQRHSRIIYTSPQALT